MYVSGAILLRYDLRKGDLLVLSCASVLLVLCGSVFSVWLIAGGVLLSSLFVIVLV